MRVRMFYVIAHLAFMSVFCVRHHQPFAVAATYSDSPRILLSLFSLLTFVHLLFFFILTFSPIRKAWLTNHLVFLLCLAPQQTAIGSLSLSCLSCIVYNLLLAELIPQVCSKIWSSHILGPKFSDKKQGNNTTPCSKALKLNVFCIGVCLSVVCCYYL